MSRRAASAPPSGCGVGARQAGDEGVEVAGGLGQALLDELALDDPLPGAQRLLGGDRQRSA